MASGVPSYASELKLINHPYALDLALFETKKNEASAIAMQEILNQMDGIRAEEALRYIACYRTGISVEEFSRPNDIVWQFHLIYTNEQTVTAIVLVNETWQKTKIDTSRESK